MVSTVRNKYGSKDFRMDAQRAWALMPTTGNFIGNIFVQVTHAFNFTTGSIKKLSGLSTLSNFVAMTTTESIIGYGNCITPNGYIGTTTIKSIFRTVGGLPANALMQTYIERDIFEPNYLNDVNTGFVAVPIQGIAGAYKPNELDLTDTVTEQRLLRFATSRKGGDVADTYNQTIAFCGWEVIFG